MAAKQNTNFPLIANKSPWASLCLLLCLVTLGAFLGQRIASVLYLTSTGNTGEAGYPTFTSRQSLLVLQAAVAGGAFILGPLLYLQVFVPEGISKLFQWRKSYTTPTLITLGLVLSFMVINTWFIQWNMTIKLPIWLKTFEIWAQEKEVALQRITKLLTSFRSMKELGVAIGVMGVIPAIGEELLFRGLVQAIFHQLTKNIHLAIGISALAFSAIHLQFYGFIPRFLLGMLFGYIYQWTKDLFFPIVAHFFNNVCTLLLFFLYQNGVVTQDLATVQAPPGLVLILCSALVVMLSSLLKQQGKCVDRT